MALSILLILTTLLLPALGSALLRAQICQVQSDFSSISQALLNYYLDHSSYPNTIHSPIQIPVIDQAYYLTTPISYMNPIPQSPWKDKVSLVVVNGVIEDRRPQANYRVRIMEKQLISSHSIISSPGWALFSGGPVNLDIGPSAKTWYSPTNGLRSWGGFYVDSNGSSTFISYRGG